MNKAPRALTSTVLTTAANTFGPDEIDAKPMIDANSSQSLTSNGERR